MKNIRGAIVIAFILITNLCATPVMYAGYFRPGGVEQHIADTVGEPRKKSAVIDGWSAPELISKQFSFTEGPAADAKGNVYFTDQPNDKIWRYSIDGKLSVFLDKAGRSNGLYFDKKGNLVACADEQNQLWSISPAGKVKILMSSYNGHRLNGPNDLWIHPSGGIYFTDPYYQRDYWDRKEKELDGEYVYYLPVGKNVAVPVAKDIVKPNGIIGTPDGRFLYVADIGDNKTYRYTINKDGTLSDRKLFVNQGSDGMTIDDKGNIYLTGQGVTVYNPEGIKIEHIPIAESWTANVCFGGKAFNYLFITASTALYKVKMKVHEAR